METNNSIKEKLLVAKEFKQKNTQIREFIKEVGITMPQYWRYQDDWILKSDKKLSLQDYIRKEEQLIKDGYYDSKFKNELNAELIIRDSRIKNVEEDYKLKLQDIQTRCSSNGHVYDNGISAIYKSHRMVGDYNVCEICRWEEKEKGCNE